MKMHFKPPLYLLMFLLAFQGCRVYHHETVAIDEAVKAQKRVKIRTATGKRMKFDRIEEKEGQYYGISEKRHSLEKTQIFPNDLTSIRLHNRAWSVIYGIGIGVVTTYVVSLATLVALFFAM